MAFSLNKPGNGSANNASDVELVSPPADSISCLSFSPATHADYLAVGSWDNEVRIYEVASNGTSQPKAMYKHNGPVLDVCWSKDGSKVFSGGVDNGARMFDLVTGQETQVAAHDAPIRAVRWIEAPTGGILATGGWDGVVKYWDLRSAQPIATLPVSERVYSMDVQYPLLIIGTAGRNIHIVNLTSPTTIFKTIESPLKWQTRVVSCLPSAKGFAVGSLEGRLAIQYLEEKDAAGNFSFRCHRQDAQNSTNPSFNRKDKDQLVYSVNSISFHEGYGTFATAGADGVINFWDGESKLRLKTFDRAQGPITATAFNKSRSMFAYAVSYDWHKGYTGMVSGHPNKVMLHLVKDEEIRRKERK